MAQTKKKRRSKHRGNPAGMVEARGRTGRKPTPQEQKRAARPNRYDEPPTWAGSAKRAIIPMVALALAMIFLLGRSPAEALPVAAVSLILYIPLTYQTDLWIYRRRQRKLAEKR